MKKKAKGKAKVGSKRTRTTDLGAKKAAAVRGGITLAAPTLASKVNTSLKEIAALKYEKY